jgi:cell division protein FtsQ
METELQKSKWIKKAELFFDNNNVLEVRISEREPIARIFTTSGLSFYLDSSLTRLPLSDKFSARLPVFTNFPTDVIVLSKEDSNLIKDIRILGGFIEANPFWMAQIDQVDISANRTFDLIPKLGNQIIHFGNAENYQEKFNNLLCFYKQVL